MFPERDGVRTDWPRDPQTVPDWLELPVHESVACPACGSSGVTIRADVCRCYTCRYGWRYPSVIGLD